MVSNQELIGEYKPTIIDLAQNHGRGAANAENYFHRNDGGRETRMRLTLRVPMSCSNVNIYSGKKPVPEILAERCKRALNHVPPPLGDF